MLHRLALSSRSQASRQLGVLVLGSGFATMTAHPVSSALCQEKKGIGDTLFPKNKDGSIEWIKCGSQLADSMFWDELATMAGSQVQAVVDSGVPTQLSYGFISGYCSGLALKKAGKAAAIILGLGFMTLQTLSYKGYIKIDHVKLKKDVEGMLDLNDDGKVDSDDGAAIFNKVVEVLEYNLPSGSGFVGGFVGGLRSG